MYLIIVNKFTTHITEKLQCKTCSFNKFLTINSQNTILVHISAPITFALLLSNNIRYTFPSVPHHNHVLYHNTLNQLLIINGGREGAAFANHHIL